MKTKLRSQTRSRGYSFVELLIVVACIAVIGTVAVAYISSSNKSLKSSKLEQDVAQLNSAVKVFTTSGGHFDPQLVTTEQEVLTELKKAASNPDSNLGLSGSLVDNRLSVVYDTEGELRDRALWNEASGKFVIERSKKGVREFVLDESLANVNFGSAARDTRLVYNAFDGWVWETIDYDFIVSTGPSAIPTINAPTLGARAGTGSPNSAKLGEPIISPGSVTLALNEYPLQVTISRSPSDPFGATIFYSTEPNVWVAYDRPIEVEPGTSIEAFATIHDSAWEDSDPSKASYGNYAETLEIALNVPKNPISYAEAGGPLEPGDYTPAPSLAPITVTLPSSDDIPDKYENSDNFRIFWTYDGSDPRTSPSRYNGSTFTDNYLGDSIDYTLPNWDGASLLPIQVIAQTNNPAVVTNSPVLSANIGIRSTALPAPLITPVVTIEEFTSIDDGASGLEGGHVDVDTSSFLAKIGRGKTDGHVHEYDDKYGVTSIDYFGLLDGKLDNIDAIVGAGKRFKLILANADLSPGAVIKINGNFVRAPSYDNSAIDELPVYSLDGHDGTTQLTSLGIHFETNTIDDGGIVPTKTGEVKKNILGRNGEWRNGALTLQAVEVDADGNDIFATDTAFSSGGVQGVATSGLLWETTVFWHWDGQPFHKNFVYDPSGYESGTPTGDESISGTVFVNSGAVVTLDTSSIAGNLPVGARIYYTTDGSDPGDDGSGNPVSGTLYTGPFDPLVGMALTYSQEIDVNARVYGPEEYTQWFNVSPMATTPVSVTIPSWEISGETVGWFSNVIGGEGLVTSMSSNNGHGNNLDSVDVSNPGEGGEEVDPSGEIDDEKKNGSTKYDYFSWGDPSSWDTGANWIQFNGTDFTEKTAGDLFRVGDLSYYNGTVTLDSTASAFDFSLRFDFNGEATTFDYSFDLLTTTNNNDAIASADGIEFINAQSAQSVNLYGVDYKLQLEFGDTSEFGFASGDSFHVHEEESASAQLFGTLVSIDSWW